MTDKEFDLHLRQLDATTAKLHLETAKLIAETHKLSTETRWCLLVVGAGATLANVALVKLFLN